jgi:hypothetical protein
MKKSSIIAFVLIVSSVITLNSCKKKTEVDNESQSAVDNALCEQQFMAIQPVTNTKGINEAGIKRTTLTCESWAILGALSNGTITPSANDTIDSNADGFYDNGPVTFQIDYGTVGCIGFDGVYRTGKLNITLPRRFSYTDSNQVVVDLIGYQANGITYSGQVKVTRANSVTCTVDVINGHCTNGTWNIDYSGTKTITQTGGQSTPNDESDDIISITGSSQGVNREGRAFTSNISNALIKKSSCKFITSGSLDLTPDGFKTRTVDFGNGDCDDKATYTVNGQTIEFTLK